MIITILIVCIIWSATHQLTACSSFSGQHCHAFGERTADVTVQRGPLKTISAASLPSTCFFYTFNFFSPVACAPQFASVNGILLFAIFTVLITRVYLQYGICSIDKNETAKNSNLMLQKSKGCPTKYFVLGIVDMIQTFFRGMNRQIRAIVDIYYGSDVAIIAIANCEMVFYYSVRFKID